MSGTELAIQKGVYIGSNVNIVEKRGHILLPIRAELYIRKKKQSSVVVAIGAGLAVWGVINLLEG